MEPEKPSFERISYLLRPRKQIERKIIIDLLLSLQNGMAVDVSDYLYIGLGSIYYYDFVLFNKFLNITDMISIDNKSCPNRFAFNRPFDFVLFHNTTTTDFLTSHKRSKKAITWLDYDSKLIEYHSGKKNKGFRTNNGILEDIRIITSKSLERDVFILTVNMQMSDRVFGIKNERQAFVDELGPYLSSKYRNQKNIFVKDYARIMEDVVINAIRNNESFRAIKFRKLFSFVYRDGAPMYTLGGMFSSSAIPSKAVNSAFFETKEGTVADINVPLLTHKEKSRLDQRINFFKEKLASLKRQGTLDATIIRELGFEIEESELLGYLKYYRYYPQYYEAIV